MIGDHYTDKEPLPYVPKSYPDRWGILTNNPSPTQQQFDELKKEVLEMKELLKKAIKYDELNNQKHCEMEEKMEVIRKVAKMVGVDISDILPEKK